MNKEKIKLTAKYDAVFKKIMSENKDILIKVLETILDKKITSLKYLNNELNKSNEKEKGKRLDLYVETNDEYIDIEVNTNYNQYIIKRNIGYGCQIYCTSMKKGEEYASFKRTRIINLIWNKKNNKAITYSYMKNQDNEIISDVLLYCEFYIDNLLEKYYNKDIEFINKYKYLIMLGLDSKELTNLDSGDEIMSKYKNELEDMESIYLEPLISEELDYKMNMQAEKEEGRIERTKEIAKQMLNNNIAIETILKCTNLTKEELEKL